MQTDRMTVGGKLRIAALGVVLLVTAALVAQAEDLPPKLQEELTKIEAKFDATEQRLGKATPAAIEQSLKELRTWIDEFALDAELLETDATLVNLNKKLSALSAKASEAAKEAAKRKPAEPAKAMTKKSRANLQVAVPVDLNNVSFKRDVAPIIANVCLRCHQGDRPNGDFNASTYNGFISQIEPGKPEASHVLDLVTGKAEPRMPRGAQSRFATEWAQVWTNWIKQGAKFDGTDKSAPITAYLIDLDTQRREMYAKMSAADLADLHRAHAERNVEIVSTSEKQAFFETPNFLVYTTLGERDAEYIAVLAESVFEELIPRFDLPRNQVLFPGKFALSVFADRTDYVAFAQEVDRYQPETHEFGHVRLRPEFQYLAMTVENTGVTLEAAVAQQVTAAFLSQLGNRRLPPWAVYGFSRYFAADFDGKSQALKGELASGNDVARQGKGATLFWESAPWIEAAPLSVSYFAYLNDNRGKPTVQFLKRFADSGNWQAALTETLKSSPEQVAQSWSQWANLKPR